MRDDARGRVSSLTIPVMLAVLLIGPLLRCRAQDGRSTIDSGALGQPSFGPYKVLRVLQDEIDSVGGWRGSFPHIVFEDTTGRFWISHDRVGTRLQVFDPELTTWRIYQSRASTVAEKQAPECSVLPRKIEYICQSEDGVMWFSDTTAEAEAVGPTAFLTSFDGSNWRAFSVPPGSLGLIQGVDGRVWMWTAGELRRWDDGRWIPVIRLSEQTAVGAMGAPSKRSPPYRFALGAQEQGREDRYEIVGGMQDRLGLIWLSTRGGVLTFDPRTGHMLAHPELNNVRSSSIYEDRSGRLWFNLGYTIEVYDPRTKSVIKVRPLDRLPKNDGSDRFQEIIGIYQDLRGRMVFGTSSGLVILDEAITKWEFADLKELGLERTGSLNALRNLKVDRIGRIWLVSFFGIALLGQDTSSRLDRDEGKVIR